MKMSESFTGLGTMSNVHGQAAKVMTSLALLHAQYMHRCLRIEMILLRIICSHTSQASNDRCVEL